MKGELETFPSQDARLWAGLPPKPPAGLELSFQAPFHGGLGAQELLSRAHWSARDREQWNEASGNRVPTPKQWPKVITLRRIPAQKKKKKVRQTSIAPGSRRYLESAGGGRRSDYSLRGAPHPLAVERIFPWGVSMSRGGGSLPLSSWTSLSPAGWTLTGPRPCSHRGPFPPSAHAGAPS